MRPPRPAIRPNGHASVELRKRRDRLTALVPLWPHEIDDTSREGRIRLAALLERALRAERRRGLAGHWTYDLARHMQLLEVYRAEVRPLRALDVKTKTAPRTWLRDRSELD